ncbi:9603_t:CDS:2, partial [Cetraspora pellucida]
MSDDKGKPDTGNEIEFNGEKALAKALCINSTLTSLDLSYNNLNFEDGKAL